MESVCNLRILRFIYVAVFAAVSIFCGEVIAQQQERITVAWKLKEGLTFKYSLYGTVSETSPQPLSSTVRSEITVAGKSENEALFTNRYTEICWCEKGSGFTSPEEELKKMSFSFPMTPSGKVIAKKGEEEAAKSIQDYLNSLIPLPPVPVKVGDSFNVEIESEKLAGVCIFKGYEKVSDRTCAFFEMRLATPHDPGEPLSKELRLKFYFDCAAGCLMRAERKIIQREKVTSAGEVKEQDKRVEELTITYQTSSEEEARVSFLIDGLKRQIELAPSDAALHQRLAEAYLEAGRANDAVSEFEEALRLKPDDAAILTRLGEMYLALGDAQSALDRFAAAIKLDKNSKKALLGASSASFQLEKYEEAANFARLAIQTDEKQFEGYYLLGIALAKSGKEKEARESLEKYLQLNPNVEAKGEYVIAFTPKGDARILAKRKGSDTQKLKYSEDDLQQGREIIRVLVKEESLRLRLTEKQLEQFLDYIAGIYGKSAPEMINDFLADRDTAANRLNTLLEEYSRIPLDALEAAAKSQPKEVPLLRAAYSFLEPEKALVSLKQLLSVFPEDASLRFDIACLYLSQGEKFFKEAECELELARDLDKENSLYDWALAYLHFKMHNQASAMEELSLTLGKSFKTDREVLAKKKLALLEAANYKKELRKVTAWTHTQSLPEKIVKENLHNLLAIAQGLLHEGKVRDARTVAQLANYAALTIEKNAQSALLLVTARSAREAALAALIKICEKTGENDKELREQFSQLARENALYLKAYLSFLRKCEDAFEVLPIIAPAEADAFIDKLLAGEIPVFDSELADVLKPHGK